MTSSDTPVFVNPLNRPYPVLAEGSLTAFREVKPLNDYKPGDPIDDYVARGGRYAQYAQIGGLRLMRSGDFPQGRVSVVVENNQPTPVPVDGPSVVEPADSPAVELPTPGVDDPSDQEATEPVGGGVDSPFEGVEGIEPAGAQGDGPDASGPSVGGLEAIPEEERPVIPPVPATKPSRRTRRSKD